MLAGALDQEPAKRDRSALALGALLCAIAVDRAGIALHHVLGQTTVRVLGTPHAETYAALLPHTMGAMRERAPEQIEALAVALGTDWAGSKRGSPSSRANVTSASWAPIGTGSTRWSTSRWRGPSSST